MNFLPIILMLAFMIRKNPSSFYNILNSIDIESIAPILELFGIDKKIVEELSSTNFQNFINGNGSIKDFLPLIPIVLKYFNFNKNPSSQSFTDASKTDFTLNEELNPIKDIANENIMSTLGNYFSS